MRLFLEGILVSAALSSASRHDPVPAGSSHGLGSGIAPNEEIARQRGPEIFNAVQNAMRQWGSSLHHNGMSFFLATVPEGVLLHHGNGSPDSPTDPDWLAYEIEHAEHFARGRRGGPGGPGGGPPGDGREPPDDGYGPPPGLLGDDQHVLTSNEDSDTKADDHGYLHVYRTTRPLRFLYVDGMGGGKTSMGTLDSQDYLLRGIRDSAVIAEKLKHDKPKSHAKRAPGGPMDEQARAVDLCKMCEDWDLQGIVRMEAGFEIIKCDFSDGLEEVQALARPVDGGEPGRRPPGGGRGGPGGGPGGMMGELEFIRGLSERYQGIGSTRTIIDYSSMVSAFFFPVNLTNPDPKRPDLPRLSSVPNADLAEIKSYLVDAIRIQNTRPVRTIDWQDVTDLIAGRYADRVKYMAEKIDSIATMKSEADFLLTVFLDYSTTSPSVPDAIHRCANFYLHAIAPVTESDRLIYAAVQTVTTEICRALFEVRAIASDNSTSETDALQSSVGVLTSLMEYLHWTRFKRCPPCAIDEVCLIPMWPFGTVEDYNQPRCTNGSDYRDGENYWGGWGRRPRGPSEDAGEQLKEQGQGHEL